MRIACVLLAACAASAPEPPPPLPRAVVVVEPPAPQPSEAPEPAPEPEVVPAFLDVDRRADDEPLRAKIVRVGPLLEADVEPPAPEATSMVLMMVPAIEETPRSVRVLCESTRATVAVYVPRYDLAEVALPGALLVPAPPLPAAIDDRTPGVHFFTGTILDRVEPDSDPALVRVRFEAFLTRAEGVVASARVGNVFPVAEEPVEPWDVELVAGAKFFDAPSGGRVVAELAAPGPGGDKHTGTKLDRSGGSILVRSIGSEAVVVGWVPAQQVRVLPAPVSPPGYGTGSGSGSPRLTRPVELGRGTLLRGVTSGKPIGVVRRDSTFSCIDRCEKADPVVRVAACTGTIDLVAARSE
jgi:hypothetical protein